MIDLYIVSVHPRFIASYCEFGAMAAAETKGLARVRPINLRDFAIDKHGSVDDRPYGGGDGMILRPEPLRDAILSCGDRRYVIYTSPGAEPFTHRHAVDLAQIQQPLVLVCGRFGGVDQRFIEKYVDQTFSVGEFVVSGGELPCLAIADAILRQVPGVLGNADSAQMDSYGSGLNGDLEGPLYTRPEVFEGVKVPEPLLSGNHEAIAAWRRKMQRRP